MSGMMAAILLPEWDMELAGLRKTLERVPDDKMDWRPHPKSPTMHWLANHLANIAGWAAMTLTTEGLDFTPDYKEPQGKTKDEILAIFDKMAAESRATLEKMQDGDLQVNWRLSNQGSEIFTMPRGAVLRGFVLSHMIHHRAQLGVYLRLNDIPVPALYGPSADEGNFG
jgi:uncharacterized damage-inducible protein DinB